MFHDASLGTDIDLAIVRLIRLEKEDHEVSERKHVNLTVERVSHA